MTHTLEKKVYYHDTDCGGVVYYANYLKYFEEGRTEYLTQLGIDLKTLSSQGTWFVVKRVEIDYKGPARYADILEIVTEVTRIRNVSIEFRQCILPKDKSKQGGSATALIEAKTTLVCIDASFRPAAIDDSILQRIHI